MPMSTVSAVDRAVYAYNRRLEQIRALVAPKAAETASVSKAELAALLGPELARKVVGQ